MPRNYQRKEGSRKYTVVPEDVIEKALQEIKAGRSQREVAKRYNISRGTLQNKVRGRHNSRPGHPTVLTELEESTIVNHLSTISDWGFPIDQVDLRILVKTYLDKTGRTIPQFKNNYPGEDWAACFLKRNKGDVTKRICQNISPKRACVDPDQIKEYFVNLEESLKDVPASNIVNYDETNLTDDPGRKKCLFRRGTKYPERTMQHSKSATSLMFAGTATGELLPIYVVYRSEHLWDTWTLGGPPGARYNRSKSGWFDSTCFEDWFSTIALPYLRRKEGPKVLIGDNLSSHFNDDVINACRQHDIRFVCLPPNSTHLCQPLDVAFFRPLKIKWREILSTWKTAGGRRTATVSKDKFPQLLKQLMEGIEENRVQNLVSGFRKAGISPLDANQVLKCIPSSEHSDAQEVQASVSEVFLSHLKAMRYGDPEPPVNKVRRKRMQVEPGKSICDATTTETSSSSEEPQSPGPSYINDYEAQSSDSDSHVSNDEQPHDPDMNSNSESEEGNESINLGDVSEGSFLLVEYQLRKSSKFYVGKVEKVAKNSIRVLFMRRQKGSEKKFVFPQIVDVDDVNVGQIVRKLPEPALRRGIHSFGTTFGVPVE